MQNSEIWRKRLKRACEIPPELKSLQNYLNVEKKNAKISKKLRKNCKFGTKKIKTAKLRKIEAK